MSWAEDNGFFFDASMIPVNSLKLDEETFRLQWTTKTGERIYIEDMETSHIRNILKAGLENRMRCDEKTTARLITELSLRIRSRNEK